MEVHPALRRIVGAVGPGEGDLQEEGFGALVAFEEIDGAVGGPARGVEPFGEDVGFGVVVVEADAGCIGVEQRGLGGEPAAVVAAEVGAFDAAAFVEQRHPVAVEVALRGVVQLADGAGEVAEIVEGAGHFVGIAGGDAAVGEHAVVPGRKAGEQAGAGGGAGGGGGVGVDEAGAVAGEAVEVGGVRGGAEAVGAVLVGHEEQHVAAGGGALVERRGGEQFAA